MIQPTPKVELFKRQLQNSLNRETKNSRIIKFSKNAMSIRVEIKAIIFILSKADR